MSKVGVRNRLSRRERGWRRDPKKIGCGGRKITAFGSRNVSFKRESAALTRLTSTHRTNEGKTLGAADHRIVIWNGTVRKAAQTLHIVKMRRLYSFPPDRIIKDKKLTGEGVRNQQGKHLGESATKR